MSDGFYKIDPTSGELLYAPNAVYGPGFTLTRDDPTSTADGWAWFDSQDEAAAGLGWTPPSAE